MRTDDSGESFLEIDADPCTSIDYNEPPTATISTQIPVLITKLAQTDTYHLRRTTTKAVGVQTLKSTKDVNIQTDPVPVLFCCCGGNCPSIWNSMS